MRTWSKVQYQITDTCHISNNNDHHQSRKSQRATNKNTVHIYHRQRTAPRNYQSHYCDQKAVKWKTQVKLTHNLQYYEDKRDCSSSSKITGQAQYTILLPMQALKRINIYHLVQNPVMHAKKQFVNHIVTGTVHAKERRL